MKGGQQAGPEARDGDALDAVIAGIHQSVFAVGLVAFKEAVLALLRPLLPFDAAVWATGEADSGRIHSIATIEYPLERLVAYVERWQAQDIVRTAATASPGRAFRNEDVMPLDAYRRSAIYREYSAPAGIEHALGITDVDPVTRVGEMVFLFRGGRDTAFADSEVRALERLMPHLVSAWRHRQMLHAHERYRQPPAALAAQGLAQAVVDDEARIHAAEPGFGLTLRAVFPDWTGPLLPEALAAPVRAGVDVADIAGLRLLLHPGLGRQLLVVQPLDRALPVSPDELRVARGHARGATPAVLAAELGMAEPEVRARLAAALARLGVADRADLVARLTAAGLD